MRTSLLMVLLIGVSAIRVDAADAPPTFEVAVEKSADQVKVKIDGHSVTFDVFSASGIGRGTITLAKGNWPTTVTLRLHLHGLESLNISTEKTSLAASVPGHGGNETLLQRNVDGKELPVGKDSLYWTEIRTLDAAGKAVSDLPGKEGYFELTVPKALWEGNPKTLKLGWIDFYRE